MFSNHSGNLTQEEKLISISNRAFQYGDGIFETLKWKNGKALFLNDHYERLCKSLDALKMDLPSALTFQELEQQLLQLTEKNNCTGAARIRLQVYRDSEGNYLPENNKTGFILTAVALENADYILNEQQINLGVYTENHKAQTHLSNIKSVNAMIYIAAALYASETNHDDCLVLNEDMNVCEAISSNVFIVEDGMLFTPPVSDGCIEGVMRRQVLKIAEQENISCTEKSLSFTDVFHADEIILTNVIQGIKAVKRYPESMPVIKRFIEKLNGN